MIYLLAFLVSAALAQPQQPDPAFMQKALDVVTAQRNNAMNGAAAAEARLAMQSDEIEKLRAEVAELKSAKTAATAEKK